MRNTSNVIHSYLYELRKKSGTCQAICVTVPKKVSNDVSVQCRVVIRRVNLSKRSARLCGKVETYIDHKYSV